MRGRPLQKSSAPDSRSRNAVPTRCTDSLAPRDAGYRDALTGSELLKTIAADAQLPRPAHLDEPGPMRF
jgi:hypothetical protein